MDERRRPKNRRGQGARLREEIVQAAAELLEETGSEDAVTLRGIARRIGVSAPALYDHFTGPGAILGAVLERAFAQFHDALITANTAAADTPGERLELLAKAYLRFAADQPHAYRTMFDRWRGDGTEEMTQARAPQELLGAAAFGLLADAVAEASPSTSDPLLEATLVWVALHGYATLRDAVPAFAWPEEDVVLSQLLPRLSAGATS